MLTSTNPGLQYNISIYIAIPVGKIAEKAVCRSVSIWHCTLSAELIKMHSFRLLFGDFAHWDIAWPACNPNHNRYLSMQPIPKYATITVGVGPEDAKCQLNFVSESYMCNSSFHFQFILFC